MRKIFTIILLTSLLISSCGNVNNILKDNTTTLNNDINEDSISNLEINTKIELNSSMIDLYDLIIEWGKIDKDLMQSAQNSDLDFFRYYKLSNDKGLEILSISENIEKYLNKDSENDDYSFFLNNAYAKKQWSIFYYVPIIGSLIKAKHKTIETSRAGIYYYMKDSLDDVDRGVFLKEYGLSSIEDIRTLSNDRVEKLARDPELRHGIDWKKITKELGETAVKTVIESTKTVLGGSFNPIDDTIDNFKKDLFDGNLELDKVVGELSEKKGNLSVETEKIKNYDIVTLGLNKGIKQYIDELGVDRDWGNLIEDDKFNYSDQILKNIGENSKIVMNKSDTGKVDFDLGEGEWDFIVSDRDMGIYDFSDIGIEEDSVTSIYIEQDDIKINNYYIGDDLVIDDVENQDIEVDDIDDNIIEIKDIDVDVDVDVTDANVVKVNNKTCERYCDISKQRGSSKETYNINYIDCKENCLTSSEEGLDLSKYGDVDIFLKRIEVCESACLNTCVVECIK